MSKKKSYPENIQKLKTLLESGNNLIDYFLVCGVEPSICLDETLFNLSSDKNTNLNNFSKILKPKIVTKFPEFDNNNDTIDDEILSYCFPNGFKPHYNDTGDKIREKKFSIILDNNLFSSEYPQKYLTCLLFYEKISQYKELSDDIIKIKTNFDKNGNCLLDESILFNNRTSIKNGRNNESLSPNKNISSTYNSFYFNDTSSNLDSTFVTENRNIRNFHLYKLKYYYIPKCICIVSIHPYIKLFQDILYLIYKYSSSSQQIPLEKIISNLLIEVPIAPRGLYYIDYMLINKYITLKRTENNKLLLTKHDLRKFHKNIQFNIQLDVFKHLLFGSKIIFFSKSINDLCEAILSFLTLLFPFKYPFQVSSYLNKDNYNILESISPFFLGINEVYNSQFFKKNDICTEGLDLFVVDLDNNITELISEEEFPDFPIKIINNFEKEIKNIDKKFIEGKKLKESEEEIEEFNEIYQEIYLYFFCDIIKNYEEYLNMNYFKNTENDIVTSIETLFNCEQFIKSHSSSEIPFYTKFVYDSQLFADFIYKRMIPKNNQERIDILLVNDILTKIKNRSKFFGKEPTDFSDGNDYKRENRYVVPKPRELSIKEKNFIKKNREKLSENGHIVREKNQNNIYFKYDLFPKLDFDIYCNNENVNDYIPPPNYSDEIERINVDVISKSSLGQNINHAIEMKNYLYLTWLEVWAFTFWYVDKNETHFRFNEMLDVLDKVKHHEMNVLNLLFDALNKSSENKMILKLYRKLLDLNINPSTFIYNIISGVLDKAQLRMLKDKKKSSEMRLNSNNDYKFKDYNIKDNKKRTFLSLQDYLEINTKLKFYSDFSCTECGEKINLLSICQNFDNIKNDDLWAPCDKCGEYILPKIKVRFGTELLRDKIYKTSSKDEIVLHSPYNLKINIKDAIVSNYGDKLNVLDFKIKFKPLFWDFIWFCKIHHLDYNIILPYLKDIEELKRLNYKNPSKEKFEVIYEDKLYKENLKKISKYSSCIYETFINSQNKIKSSENFMIQKQVNNFGFIGIIKQKDKEKEEEIINNNKVEENKEKEINEEEDRQNEINEVNKEKETNEKEKEKEINEEEKEKEVNIEQNEIKEENKQNDISKGNEDKSTENNNIKEREININIYENENNENNENNINEEIKEKKDKSNTVNFLDELKNKIDKEVEFINNNDTGVIPFEQKNSNSSINRSSLTKNIDPNIEFED